MSPAWSEFIRIAEGGWLVGVVGTFSLVGWMEVCLYQCQSDLFLDKEKECADDGRRTLWTLRAHHTSPNSEQVSSFYGWWTELTHPSSFLLFLPSYFHQVVVGYWDETLGSLGLLVDKQVE